ncbi:TPA: hypothetical protein N0F65_006525 [Lagenidium giganteum]|uniref:Crossover junction endonuclease MUS81 n=1 Tax=Lagenidium giganteum TaxID=4803 RepID=A0AAV2YH61_9STRA|nr:TPA: hypothetical protein N0F65_006525 [Lagenidium giganteum]
MRAGEAMAIMASDTAGKKRKRRSAHGCVNEGNDKLVEELKKVRARIRESSHLHANYGRAITSLQQYDQVITNGHQAKQLKNIGNYIANQIQAIIQKLRNEDLTTSASSSAAGPVAPSADAASRQKKPATAAPQSVGVDGLTRGPVEPWYVLLVLGESRAIDDTSAMQMELLLGKMQLAGYEGSLAKLRACIASLSCTHQVVQKTSLGRVFLTVKGQRCAASCQAHAKVTKRVTATTSSAVASSQPAGATSGGTNAEAPMSVDCIALSDDASDSEPETIPGSPHNLLSVEPETEPTTGTRTQSFANEDWNRPSDNWEIVLLLDHREVLSRRNRSILERKLIEHNVTCEVRSLHVGDVQWIARRHRSDGSCTELMLNAIVERKEAHDLSGSIIDRRYAEQKTRLKSSGLTHVIYLVEGSLSQQTTVRTSGLQTALCRTQVQNNFFVQHCQNADETVAFLGGVHRRLLAHVPSSQCSNSERAATNSSTPLSHVLTPAIDDFERIFCSPLTTFDEFNAQFRKRNQFTVREIYQMMLTQVPGLSSTKTLGVSKSFETFHRLTRALKGDKRLSDIRCGESQRRIGAKQEEFLQHLLTATTYDDMDGDVDCA